MQFAMRGCEMESRVYSAEEYHPSSVRVKDWLEMLGVGEMSVWAMVMSDPADEPVC